MKKEIKLEIKIDLTTPEAVFAFEKEQPFLRSIEAIENQIGPFEFIPWREKEPIIFQRLQQLVVEAKTNPWWSQRLNSAGVQSLTDWNEWQNIPLTTRDNLVEGFVNSKAGLIIPWNLGDYMLVGSGATTTGKPIITLYPQLELKAISKRAGSFFARHIFFQQEKKPYIGNVLAASNGWASHALLQKIIDQIPGINTTPLGELKSIDVLKFWLDQGLTGFLGLPDELFILAKQIQESTEKQWLGISTIIFGGGFLTVGMLEQIKKVFPNLNNVVSHFSSTQALHMGVLVDGQIRVADDLHFLEITDEKGRWLPEGQPGKLIVTRLQSPSTVLRMDIGDIASISSPNQSDLLQSRIIKLHGREGEDIRIASFSVPIQLLHQTTEALLQDLNIKPIKIQFVYRQDTSLTINIVAEDQEQNFFDNFPIDPLSLLQSRGLFSQGILLDGGLPPEFTINFQITNLENLIKTPAGKIPVLIKQ